MKKKTKTNSNSLYSKVNRQDAIDQGFYDGRYRKRVIPNKKKEESKSNKYVQNKDTDN